MKNLKLGAIGLLAGILAACGGGGGDATIAGDGGGTTTGGGPVVNSLQVIASSPQLVTDQSGDSFVKISGVVRDTANNVVAGEDLLFIASSGSIEEVDNGVTNSSGIGEALLKSFGDVTNRDVTVTVQAPSAAISNTVTVQVTGTSLTATGPAGAPLGDTVVYTLSLKDGKGVGIAGETIALVSQNNNSFDPATATVVTGPSGEAQFSVTADTAGDDVITASVLGIDQAINLSVSNDVFAFTSPAEGTEVGLTPASETLTIQWQQGGFSVPDGSTIEFTADRGTLSTGSATTTGGVATLDIDSLFAGNATITASGTTLGAAPLANGPTTQLTIEFVADTPDNVTLGVFPDVLVVGEQATITAVVKDAAGNRVKGVNVDFNITSDQSLGQLTVSSDVTDSQGAATTIFRAGNSTTSENGVVIEAEVRGTAINDTVALTVSGRTINFVIGTGNDLFEIEQNGNQTRFGYPWSITATDTNGRPVSGEPIRLSIRSTDYYKGSMVKGTDAWFRPIHDGVNVFKCEDEDYIGYGNGNGNRSLDAGEDFNGSGELEAGNVATIVPTACQGVGATAGVTQADLATDDAGAIEVCVVYPQDHNLWVDVELLATMSVDGTENVDSRDFLLPALATDLANVNGSPPGVVSPFGVNDCSQPD